MRESIALMIQQFGAETPQAAALIVNDEICTYEELARANRKVAGYLWEKGIRPGDRIVVESDHTLPYTYFWYGLQLLGATLAPIEKESPSNRVLEIAQQLQTEYMVTLTARDDLPQGWSLEAIMPEILTRDDSFVPVAPDSESLAEILFTTGTTGKSKGVMVSYGNQVNIAMAGAETGSIQADDVWLIPTPMNHAAGLRKCNICMAVGCAAVLLEGFRNFKKFFKTIHDHKVTGIYLPPSAIHLLLAVASKNLAELNGQLRFIYSSSSAYPETDKEKMRKLMPDVYMYNCWGCSEVGVAFSDEFCVSGGSAYPGSVGKPNSFSEVFAVDENYQIKENATAQDPGLLAIRSKSVTKGYWNEPEQTAKAFPDGMLVTSDLCYFAPNGEVILVGRSNDTISLGGFKVAPLEVEEVAMQVPCVDECLLIPVVRGGNTALKLLVVLKEGMELDEVSIRETISRNLEPYKLPKQIMVIDEIMRTFNGKIDRKKMIAAYA